jgi:AcrR family transcriptional regulator
LLRSVIAAVGEAGFRDVTVSDIVRGARVSRAAFYAHFSDKEDCFLAATRQGGLLMANRVMAAARRQPADASAEATLRPAQARRLRTLSCPASSAARPPQPDPAESVPSELLPTSGVLGR